MIKTVLIYVTILGGCLIILWQVLHAGKDLKAPAGISGVWTVTEQTDYSASADCNQNMSFFQEKNPTFTIRQSGTKLTFILNDSDATTLSGEIQQLKVNASSDLVQLTAEVHRGQEDAKLEGKLSFISCDKQLDLQFQALKTIDHSTGTH